MEDVYFLQKEGAVYPQGIFWIGHDVESGKSTADMHARLDIDSYHDWVIYKYIYREPQPDVNCSHEKVYSANKRDFDPNCRKGTI